MPGVWCSLCPPTHRPRGNRHGGWVYGRGEQHAARGHPSSGAADHWHPQHGPSVERWIGKRAGGASRSGIKCLSVAAAGSPAIGNGRTLRAAWRSQVLACASSIHHVSKGHARRPVPSAGPENAGAHCAIHLIRRRPAAAPRGRPCTGGPRAILARRGARRNRVTVCGKVQHLTDPTQYRIAPSFPKRKNGVS